MDFSFLGGVGSGVRLAQAYAISLTSGLLKRSLKAQRFPGTSVLST